MKKPVLNTALILVLFGITNVAMADSTSDIFSSENQVSLSYATTTVPDLSQNFNGAVANIDYLGTVAGIKNVYLSANASESSLAVPVVGNANNYNYGLQGGYALDTHYGVVVIPYARLGHELLSAASDTSTANSYGAGLKALYSPAAHFVLSVDVSADHETGDVSYTVATAEGLATNETVGVDYALPHNIHLSAGYGHNRFSVAGNSHSNDTTTVGVGLGF